MVEEEWRSVHFELDFFNFSILILFCVCVWKGRYKRVDLAACFGRLERVVDVFLQSIFNQSPS